MRFFSFRLRMAKIDTFYDPSYLPFPFPFEKLFILYLKRTAACLYVVVRNCSLEDRNLLRYLLEVTNWGLCLINFFVLCLIDEALSLRLLSLLDIFGITCTSGWFINPEGWFLDWIRVGDWEGVPVLTCSSWVSTIFWCTLDFIDSFVKTNPPAFTRETPSPQKKGSQL